MNNTIYRSGHLQNSITVDPNYLERIEVLYGPSSVSYGSDAIGGVVHYFTKIPEFSVEKEIDFKKKRSYNLTNKSKTRNYQLTASNKNWGLFSSLSISDYGDIIMGKNRKHGFEDWGLVNHFSENNRDNFFLSPSVNSDPNVQRNTAYDQKDFITKVNLKLKNDSNLILNFQVSKGSNKDKVNMARISGIDIPKEKRGVVALTYIFGIGSSRAKKILINANVSEEKKVLDWSDEETANIRAEVSKLTIEGELRAENQINIKRLMDIGSYRGIRHRIGLPLRGQRTKNNSRTRKGKRKTVANKKKVTK